MEGSPGAASALSIRGDTAQVDAARVPDASFEPSGDPSDPAGTAPTTPYSSDEPPSDSGEDARTPEPAGAPEAKPDGGRTPGAGPPGILRPEARWKRL